MDPRQLGTGAPDEAGGGCGLISPASAGERWVAVDLLFHNTTHVLKLCLYTVEPF